MIFRLQFFHKHQFFLERSEIVSSQVQWWVFNILTIFSEISFKTKSNPGRYLVE